MEFLWGGGRVGVRVGGRQGRCEQRSEVFVKIKKNGGGKGGSGPWGTGWGGGRGQGRCEQRSEVFVKIQFFFFILFFFFWGGVGLGGDQDGVFVKI